MSNTRIHILDVRQHSLTTGRARRIDTIRVEVTEEQEDFVRLYGWRVYLEKVELIAFTEKMTITRMLRDAGSEEKGLEMLLVWAELIKAALAVYSDYPDIRRSLTVKLQMIEAKF